MSSKKFVYLVMTVAIVCGFIASDAAHGQSTGSLTFGGSVLDADDNPVPGYTISAEFVPARTGFQFIPVSRPDGSYSLAVLGFAIGGPTPKINVGDVIKITATGADGTTSSATHTVTAADTDTSRVDNFNIVLSGLTVQADPPSIPAHDANTSTITVTVREGGEGVTGDAVSLAAPAGKGTVDATATEVGAGVYTATYTAPSLALTGPESVEISVSSATTGVEKSVSIQLTPVPTTVDLQLGKSGFIADTPETTTVTVTVERIDPVTDENVTLTLNPAAPAGGAVSAVTNNRDGTYSATYTSSGTAGNVTLTALATQALATDAKTITINAGPPANVVVTAAPTVVTSLGSATITAMVTDNNGNPAGATLAAETTSGGTVGEFTSTVFGTYIATYTAPELDVEETETIAETITVTADDASGSVAIELLPEDPIDVTIMTIEGTVYTEDPEITADEGTEVTVTVGENSKMTTTDANGYMVLFIGDLISPVATTGDMVSVAVGGGNVVSLNVNGTERAGSSFRLINAILEKVQADESVMIDVSTDIVVPPRTVTSLVVEGMVYTTDGVTSAGSSLDVTITVGANTQTVQTKTDGSYEALFIADLITTVATTGDSISVVVSDGSGPRGENEPDESTLSNKDLDTYRTGSATVERNVITNIKLTTSILAVGGTVYLKNGDTDSVAAAKHLRETELTVVATNTTRNIPITGSVDDEGQYEILFVGPSLATVAETDDEIVIEVQNDAGETVGSESYTLTDDNIKATRADMDIDTNVPARVLVLHVEGDVIELNGNSAGPGVEVTLTIVMNGTPTEARAVTDAAGRYRYLFNATPETPAARTDDILKVQVLRVANGYFGYRELDLRTHQIVYVNQPLIVMPAIQLIPPTLRLGGLSINTDHADQYYGYLSLEAIQKNPELLQLIPSGILHVDLSQNLLASLPAGFNPTPDPTANILERFDIDSENFGNGITPRPSWHVLGEGSTLDPGRWVNGNQLNLYVVTGPVPSVQSVTFTLDGPAGGTIEAAPVAADGYMHNFQLEEERAILFLPSWPSLNMNAPIFSGVTLMIDGGTPMPMTSKLVGDEVVWEAPATLTAGATVYYHYQVTLAQPYQLEDGTVVSSWPMPDPRNLQVQNRGIVETLLAPDVPELKEIVTTTDLKLRSVFDVPALGANESLWVARVDFPAGADGEYSVDTVVQYEGGLTRGIPDQMFTLDRGAPAAGITAAIGESAGLYQRDDGSYVTAAHTDAGTLNLTPMPMMPMSEADGSAAYLYQIIELGDEGKPGNQVWNPITVTGDMLPLTYMEPHQIQIPIGDLGNYGIRAVGIDSILNIASNTMPRMLDIVPPDPDVAELTLVHADFINTDGAFDKEQPVSDGVTIFSDLSPVTLTFGMTATDHPITSIVVDFQIDGAGDWKPIAMLTGEALVAAKAGFEVTWDRTADFADLLDMRGEATVRVTVENALDLSAERSATFEVVPPALELGGLSISTNYEAGVGSLQALQGLDITALATELLGMDPASLISPSPLPLALGLLGLLSHVQSTLPEGFETGMDQIHRENFGNAVTPKPIWHFMASPDQQDAGRWVNGNQLHLYTFAGPTAESLTFSLTGAGTATATAEKVAAGGSFMYNFQLEEELVAVFAGSMPAFAAVTLMVDGHAPIDMVGHAGVWSAQAALTPGSKVAYYYVVELAQPYQDPLINRPIQVFPIPDLRNLQIETDYAHKAIMALLNGGVDALATLDPGMRSVFNVPAVDDASQSLWVGKLDFPADGMYQLDVAVQYSGGSTDKLAGKMFTVDRTAPTADTAVHLDAPGENIGMYEREADGVYVAAALNPGGASLNVSAEPIDDSDLEAYLYQFARLDDATGAPGTWNPMLTVDLMGLDLGTFLSVFFTNPAGVVPLTSMPPHHTQMLIRSETGNGLAYGTYGLRVVGFDNILNADSSRGPGVELKLVPPDPDVVSVTSVQSDFDRNGVIEGHEMQVTAGGNAIIFSDALVELTLHVTTRTDHPLTSIAVQFQIPGGGWEDIYTFSAAELKAAMPMQGDALSVNWAVPDFPALQNRGDEVMVRIVTTNALTIETEEMTTLAYERRLAPDVSAIHTYVTDYHPVSGAPQGSLTVSAFTQAMTAPDTTAVELTIRRYADAESETLGVVEIANTTVISIDEEPNILLDRVNTIVSGAPAASYSPLYRKWSYTFDSATDSATPEDTIMDNTPAASDASLDDNPYVLQAIAIDAADNLYPSADGVMDKFSLDNHSPTEITQIDNKTVEPPEYGSAYVSDLLAENKMVAPREDGSYYVSGLLAEGVPDPMLALTSWTGAHPNAFTGGIALAVNDASGTAVEIPETPFSGAGNYTYTGDFNLASLLNGPYTFMAVAHAADGTVETRIVAMPTAVEVGNYNPLTDIVSIIIVDTEGDDRSPSEINTMYPIGFPAIDDTIDFTFTVSNVAANEIDVMIGANADSARVLGALSDDGIVATPNADGSTSFAVTLDTSVLDEGPFNLVGTVIKPNGVAPFDLPSIRVDRSGPVVEIVSPTSRAQLTGLPTIQITYLDASGFDPNDMTMETMPVVITLTRLPSGEMIDIVEELIHITTAPTNEILTQMGHIVYTHTDSLIGGAYRIEATVTDVLGNVTSAEPVEITVEGIKPTVSIISPLTGVIVDPKQPLIISTAVTGNGDITVTEFQINGTDVTGTLEGNWLTYTMEPPLVGAAESILQRGSGNIISVKIVDSEGRTADSAISFAVSLDNTAPVISRPTPEGDVTRELGQITAITAVVTDNESDITSIQLTIDDNPLPDLSFSPGSVVEVMVDQTHFDFANAPLGPHSVTVVAESTGGSSSLTWTFNIVAPEPTVSIESPLTGVIVDPEQPLIISAAVTGNGDITVTEFQINGMDIEGTLANNWLTYTMEPPLVGADSILKRGSDNTISVKIVDSEGLTAESAISFAVSLDDTPPVISGPTPEGDVTRALGQITAQVSDNESDIIRIQLAIDDNPLQDLTFAAGRVVEVMDQTGFSFADAPLGTHSVTVVAESTGGSSSLTWTFNIVAPEPTVSIESPLTGVVVDPEQPLIISAALTGAGDITVTEFQINGMDIEGTLANNWLTYTMEPPLVGAADSILQRGSDNTISIKIVDSEGLTAEGSTSFAVSLDDTPPAISGPAPTGDITRKIGRVTARVTDNESNITRIQFALDDNPLTDISFSPGRVIEVGKGTEVQGQTNFNFFDAPFGTHTVTIVAESTGGTTTLTWEFTIVNPDSEPPKVVTYSPLGIIRTDRPILAATVSDESGFKRDGITLILAGVPGNQGSGRRSSPTSTTVTFTPSISVTPGPYTARLTVVDKYNNRTEAEWQFTVELDETPPAITTSSPHGVIRSDKPIISVSASDDMSGVDTIDISVKGEKWNIAGVTTVRSDKTSATFTPTASLESGIYTVNVKLADVAGNKASGQWQFTVELDTIAPSVLMTRPTQEHTENRRPIISATYTDNLSGVDRESVTLSLNGATVEPDELSDTQVVFTPTYDLPFGPHTVKLEVSDLAPQANTAVQEWTFYVERMGIADARNYPNPFDHETTIAFRISRQAKITIRVYDFTGRLVATPLSNSVREAGVVEVDWHGETNAGDHLARGVYFCHILMESELEPQSAILKMAIIRD